LGLFGAGARGGGVESGGAVWEGGKRPVGEWPNGQDEGWDSGFDLRPLDKFGTGRLDKLGTRRLDKLGTRRRGLQILGHSGIFGTLDALTEGAAAGVELASFCRIACARDGGVEARTLLLSWAGRNVISAETVRFLAFSCIWILGVWAGCSIRSAGSGRLRRCAGSGLARIGFWMARRVERAGMASPLSVGARWCAD